MAHQKSLLSSIIQTEKNILGIKTPDERLNRKNFKSLQQSDNSNYLRSTAGSFQTKNFNLRNNSQPTLRNPGEIDSIRLEESGDKTNPSGKSWDKLQYIDSDSLINGRLGQNALYGRRQIHSLSIPYLNNMNTSSITPLGVKSEFLRKKQANPSYLSTPKENLEKGGTLLGKATMIEPSNPNATMRSSFNQENSNQFMSPLRETFVGGNSYLEPGYFREKGLKGGFLESIGLMNSTKWGEKYTKNIEALRIITPRETVQETVEILHNSSNMECMDIKSKSALLNRMPFQKNMKIHSSQNIMTSGRRDVIDLFLWLDEMIKSLEENQDLTLKEVFDFMQTVYSACVRELIKQVSVDCVERAQLLQKVWDANMSLLSKLLLYQNQLCSDQEKQGLEDTKRLHQIYQKDLGYKLSKITMLNEGINEKNKVVERLGKEIRSLRKKLTKFESVNKNLIDQLTLLQDDNCDLANENMRMSMALTDIDANAALAFNQKYIDTIKSTLNKLIEDQLELEDGDFAKKGQLKKRRISEIMKKIEEKKATQEDILKPKFEVQTEKYSQKAQNLKLENKTKQLEEQTESDHSEFDRDLGLENCDIGVDTADLIIFASVYTNTKDLIKIFHTEIQCEIMPFRIKQDQCLQVDIQKQTADAQVQYHFFDAEKYFNNIRKNNKKNKNKKQESSDEEAPEKFEDSKELNKPLNKKLSLKKIDDGNAEQNIDTKESDSKKILKADSKILANEKDNEQSRKGFFQKPDLEARNSLELKLREKEMNIRDMIMKEFPDDEKFATPSRKSSKSLAVKAKNSKANESAFSKTFFSNKLGGGKSPKIKNVNSKAGSLPKDGTKGKANLKSSKTLAVDFNSDKQEGSLGQKEYKIFNKNIEGREGSPILKTKTTFVREEGKRKISRFDKNLLDEIHKSKEESPGDEALNRILLSSRSYVNAMKEEENAQHPSAFSPIEVFKDLEKCSDGNEESELSHDDESHDEGRITEENDSEKEEKKVSFPNDAKDQKLARKANSLDNYSNNAEGVNKPILVQKKMESEGNVENIGNRMGAEGQKQSMASKVKNDEKGSPSGLESDESQSSISSYTTAIAGKNISHQANILLILDKIDTKLKQPRVPAKKTQRLFERLRDLLVELFIDIEKVVESREISKEGLSEMKEKIETLQLSIKKGSENKENKMLGAHTDNYSSDSDFSGKHNSLEAPQQRPSKFVKIDVKAVEVLGSLNDKIDEILEPIDQSNIKRLSGADQKRESEFFKLNMAKGAAVNGIIARLSRVDAFNNEMPIRASLLQKGKTFGENTEEFKGLETSNSKRAELAARLKQLRSNYQISESLATDYRNKPKMRKSSILMALGKKEIDKILKSKGKNVEKYGEAVKLLFKRVKDSNNQILRKSPINLTSLMKMISFLYVELIKILKKDEKIPVLSLFVYDYFINHFGLKKVSETKMLHLIKSCQFFSEESAKVRIFFNFLDVNSVGVYTTEELEFYLKLLFLLDENLKMHNFNIDRITTSLIKIEEVMTHFFENQLPRERIHRLREDINLLSPSRTNSDLFPCEKIAERLLKEFCYIKDLKKDQLRDFFFCMGSMDIDNLGVSWEEYLLLVNLMDDSDDKEYQRVVFFFSESDIALPPDEKRFSFDRFAQYIIRRNIYNETKLKEFLTKCKRKSNIKKIEEFEFYWENECNKYQQLVSEADENLRVVLDNLRKFFKGDKTLDKKFNMTQAITSFRILEEAVRINNLKNATDLMIPEEFNHLHDSFLILLQNRIKVIC